MTDVELRGVTKRYGSVTAVKDVNLAIDKGSFFSLLGPSGCGKTTTLRLIAGFEEPSGGDIFIQGQAVKHLPAYQRKVNTVFQSYALFPHLNVFENIAFGLRRRGGSKSDIEQGVAEALRQVHLEGFEQRRPQQMSGGEQQRVAMARALVNRPPVLLLDEPLSALDEKLRKQMQGELKKLQRELGITFILVTHDQEEALTLSDRLAVMNAGCVEQAGTPAEIYENPATRFVTDFIGATNFLRGQVVEVPTPGTAVVDLGSERPITLPWHDGVPHNVTLEFFVRPEKMWLSLSPPTNGGASVNYQQGKLIDSIYQGAVTRYRVALASQGEIFVAAQNSEGNSLPAEPGQTVWVQWNPQSTRLVKPETNSKEH